MTLEQYINNINNRYKLGNATEHTFRGDLQQLLESLVPDIRATNEPKRQSCGAPDYILTKKEIPVGFIEAKDIGDKDLEGAKKTGNKEQFDRYKASLNNLIFTDYLDFHLYIDGIFITKIAIARLEFPSTGGVPNGRGGSFTSGGVPNGRGGSFTSGGVPNGRGGSFTTGGVPNGRGGFIVPLPENFATFTNLIKDFASHVGQTIKSSKKLAEMMAGKARLLSDVIEKALTSDEEKHEDSTLKDQMNAFKQILIHDITPKGFADVYAQTISYGMFAARLHDPTLPTFSRQEAAELIPKSNPFLRKLFGYIAGPDIDDRIKWIVDSLVDIFLACNVEEILKNYGKSTKMEDPIIHFYETFLSEYDPKLRKARGVWYTPAPVVNFIVRAVDDILKTEFDLPNGLADSSKINHPSPSKGGELVHKVQILDPATGTGTFLAETIKHIHKKFEGQQGIWSNYVETHLLPRLNGFELLMASYAMAHLKLDLLLTETGYKKTTPPVGHPSKGGEQRLRVYLTNSLEESHPDTGTLFANWLSTEANEANHIKRDSPVMCVIGNPPYFGFKSNNGEWITNLTNDYKFIDGQNINEKKHRLGNDYVKFIRFGQYFIEKNQSGILSYINDHGFLFNPTFKGMRWNLMKSFDKIYILDLHGNSKKKEKGNDGSKDENVFDIQQGVSINIFVKTGKKKKNELAKIFYYDILGLRNMKYDFLSENSLSKIQFKEIFPSEPFYFFLPNKLTNVKDYEVGFSMSEFFNIGVTGTVTGDDNQLIAANRDELEQRLSGVVNAQIDSNYVKSIEYRPFDKRAMYFLETFNKNPYSEINVPASYRSRHKVMQHLTKKDNYCLVIGRQGQVVGDMPWNIIFVSNSIVDLNMFYRGGGVVSPLYLYPETNGQQTIGQMTTPSFGHPSKGELRTPNLNTEIVKQIAEKLGLTFVPEKFPSFGGVAESRGGETTGGVAESRGGETTGGVAESRGGETTGGVAESRGGRNTKNYMDLPYNPNLKERAKELRQAGNLSEVLFWNQVKNKQFKGFDFDRQKIVGNYIVDFYCSNCNVVIEIDGSSHDDKQEYDAARDSFLESLGLTVIHIPVIDVMKNMGGLMDMLFNHHALKGTPPEEGNFAPIDILDYIYAVLHSPTYREKYKEFLKIDFPRVPYPKDKDTFWQLVKLGGEIRQIHLLESPTVEKYITQYPEDGSNVVVKPRFVNSPPLEGLGVVGKVYINDTQYFNNVPQVAWEFYIGGYQPAQKWLKDRKERTLEFDDILHYQKIIVALSETDRLMKEIEKIEIE